MPAHESPSETTRDARPAHGSPTRPAAAPAGIAAVGASAAPGTAHSDALAATLARAVRRRAGHGAAPPGSHGDPALARRAVVHTSLAEQMLAAPEDAGIDPNDDELMRLARALGHRRLWGMRLAVVWGGVAEDYARGSWRPASPGERIARLERGASEGRRLLGDDEQAAAALAAAVRAARARILDEGVAQKLVARPDVVYEAPEVVLERERAAVLDTLNTFKQLGLLQDARYFSTNLTRLTPEQVRGLELLKARTTAGSFLHRLAQQPIANAIYVVKGLLSALDLALKIADPKQRAKQIETIGSEHGITLRGVTHDLAVVTQAVEAAFTIGGMAGFVGLCARGKGKEAVAWLRLFTAPKPDTGRLTLAVARNNFLMRGWWRLPLRTVSWLASGVQLVYGLATWLDPKNDSEELEAAWTFWLGASGLAGLGFTGLNWAALASLSGIFTGALLSGGAIAWYGRRVAREQAIAEAHDFTEWLFAHLEEQSAEVAREAGALHGTLRLAREAGANEVGDAAARRADGQAAALRDTMVLAFLSLADPGLRVPRHVKRPFEQVKRRVAAARTPAETLSAARTFLAVVRDLFSHFERTVARTLKEQDANYHRSWSDPWWLFRGLHDDVKVAPVEQDVLPAPVAPQPPALRAGAAAAIRRPAP